METIANQDYTVIRGNGVKYFKVAPSVWGMRIVFVNIFIIEAANGEWVLVDAGLKGAHEKIKRMAEDIFGENARPSAILLTHGHTDHTGALNELLSFWPEAPVYAHYLELPYLKGASSYPPPDPMVGGGLMSLLSWTFPRKPGDFGKRVHRLPADGMVPVLTDWKFIHTPGHSPGHVSLFRQGDGTLIAGDAFVTTKQESAFSVMTQQRIVSGPPKYFTIDWKQAKESVRKLAALKPSSAAAGHGLPMYGEELQSSLDQLSANFDKVAVPNYGRYVKEPARANKNGVQYVPERVNNPGLLAGIVLVGALAAFAVAYPFIRRKGSTHGSLLNKLGI
jgi:glyoxylase-like metal-dependent hydrolase (beta-lactamase superfamily II)